MLNNEEMKYKNGHDKTRKDDGRVTISAKVVQSEIQRSNQEQWMLTKQQGTSRKRGRKN